MAIYDLYGFPIDDLAKAKSLAESSLGIEFEVRESDFQGGTYLQWGKSSEEHLMLKRNIDPFDDEAAELDFAEYKILLYANDTPHSDDFRKKLDGKGFVLLRHEDLN